MSHLLQAASVRSAAADLIRAICMHEEATGALRPHRHDVHEAVNVYFHFYFFNII